MMTPMAIRWSSRGTTAAEAVALKPLTNVRTVTRSAEPSHSGHAATTAAASAVGSPTTEHPAWANETVEYISVIYGIPVGKHYILCFDLHR